MFKTIFNIFIILNFFLENGLMASPVEDFFSFIRELKEFSLDEKIDLSDKISTLKADEISSSQILNYLIDDSEDYLPGLIFVYKNILNTLELSNDASPNLKLLYENINNSLLDYVSFATDNNTIPLKSFEFKLLLNSLQDEKLGNITYQLLSNIPLSDKQFAALLSFFDDSYFDEVKSIRAEEFSDVLLKKVTQIKNVLKLLDRRSILGLDKTRNFHDKIRVFKDTYSLMLGETKYWLEFNERFFKKNAIKLFANEKDPRRIMRVVNFFMIVLILSAEVVNSNIYHFITLNVSMIIVLSYIFNRVGKYFSYDEVIDKSLESLRFMGFKYDPGKNPIIKQSIVNLLHAEKKSRAFYFGRGDSNLTLKNMGIPIDELYQLEKEQSSIKSKCYKLLSHKK